MKWTLSLGCALSALIMTSAAIAETQIKLYTWRQQEIPLWEHINDNNLIDGVKIKVMRIIADNYRSKLKIDMQSNAADIFQLHAGAQELAPWIESGIIKELPFSLDMMAPAAIEAARGADNKLYGVPFAMQLQSLMYNTAVFSEHNITEPHTLEELEQAFDTLKSAGIVPMHVGGRSGWWLNQVVSEVMLAGMVDDTFSAGLIDGTHCFTEAPYVETLAQLKNWKDKGYFNHAPLDDDYGSMRTAFALGESATMLDGVWSTGPTSPLYEINPDLMIGMMPVPGEHNKIYAFGDGSYVANEQSEHPEAAQQVLKFMTTRKFAELFAEHVGELPAYGQHYEIAEARLRGVAEMIASNSQKTTPFFAYSLNRAEPSYSALLVEAYQGILADKTTPAEAAQSIQDGLNSWNYVGSSYCS